MIVYSHWQSYPWKNELTIRMAQIATCFNEIQLDDEKFVGDHNPLHMIDRAIVIAAFVIRRMFETKLVKDNLAQQMVPVRIFLRNSSKRFRKPFHSTSGESPYENYNLQESSTKELKIDDIANEIIHASQLMFIYDDEKIEAGILIASDWHMKNRLLHLTVEEFFAFARLVLDDHVSFTKDARDAETGEISSIRE